MALVIPLSPRSWHGPQITFACGDGVLLRGCAALMPVFVAQVLADYTGRGNVQDPIARLRDFHAELVGGSERLKRLMKRARDIIRSGNPGIVRGGFRPTARASRPHVWNDLLSRRIEELLANSSLVAGHA
jgi:hypothetical protein